MRNVLIKFALVIVLLTTVLIACEKIAVDEGGGDALGIKDARTWFETKQPEFLVLKSGSISEMKKVYEKKLAPSESSRHYVRILEEYRDLFPLPYSHFSIKINDEIVDVTLDASYRIWIGAFWKKLPTFKMGDTIIFTKEDDGYYTVTMKKTGSNWWKTQKNSLG